MEDYYRIFSEGLQSSNSNNNTNRFVELLSQLLTKLNGLRKSTNGEYDERSAAVLSLESNRNSNNNKSNKTIDASGIKKEIIEFIGQEGMYVEVIIGNMPTRHL